MPNQSQPSPQTASPSSLEEVQMWFVPSESAPPFLIRRGETLVGLLTPQQWWRLARGREEILVVGGKYVKRQNQSQTR